MIFSLLPQQFVQIWAFMGFQQKNCYEMKKSFSKFWYFVKFNIACYLDYSYHISI